MRTPLASLNARRTVDALPSVDELWRLANGVSLEGDERKRLDGAIAWALGTSHHPLPDATIVQFLGTMAFADGALHERELRLLLRTLLRRGVSLSADLSLVRSELEGVIAQVDTRGAPAVVTEAAAALNSPELRRAMLRLTSLCVVADHALDEDELQGWQVVASALGAAPAERRNTLAAAAALYARG